MGIGSRDVGRPWASVGPGHTGSERPLHAAKPRRPGAEPLTVNIMEDNLSYMRTEAPLLAPIFRSDGQARLLSTLLLTGDELSVTDLAKRAGLAYPTVHREVARLVDAGILTERQVGRTRLIRANDESPLVGPLREILTVATGPVVVLAEELGRIDGIESAFLYGSFAARMLGDAGPAPHDIDVMVLGEPDVDAVYEACTRVEAAVHRPVNPTILTPEEFAAPSGFLDNVRNGPAVAVIGELPWR
jgi:DNA-binding transcriptional ArsR family regulator